MNHDELDDAAAFAESEGAKAQAEADACNAEMESRDYVEAVEALLWECARELEYIQCVENCGSGLCATSLGKELVHRALELLKVDFYCETYREARARGVNP